MISCHVGQLKANRVPKIQLQRWRQNIKVVVGEFEIKVISKWSFNFVQLSLGMATGRVWDGPLLPHFRPSYIFFFPSPFQTWGGVSWCLSCPFTKKLIILSLSQMYFRELCFYRTWVFEISINVIWVIINTFNQAFIVQQNCKLHTREQNAQIYK